MSDDDLCVCGHARHEHHRRRDGTRTYCEHYIERGETGGARRITIAVRERRELVRTFSARTDAEAQAAFARFVETGRCW